MAKDYGHLIKDEHQQVFIKIYRMLRKANIDDKIRHIIFVKLGAFYWNFIHCYRQISKLRSRNMNKWIDDRFTIFERKNRSEICDDLSVIIVS